MNEFEKMRLTFSNFHHIGILVRDLDQAIEGRQMVGEITIPSPGIRVAMIVENGAPVELMEFRK